MYRSVQEALRKAYRHAAGAGQAVRATALAGQLEIAVADTGSGFDPSAGNGWNEHLGLIGMRERVESLGGTFCVESQSGWGTQIIARLPLRGEGLTPV